MEFPAISTTALVRSVFAIRPSPELGIVGAAVGAALVGMKPIVEIQFSDFTAQAMDQIVNQAAKIHFMLGGELSVPMVLRAPSGSGTGAAAQHSQSLESWFAHVPGLKVVLPSSPADAKGLLLAALDDPNPVIVLEHKLLYKTSGHVPEEMYRTPIGVSNTVREGSDLTIVATGVMVSRSLEAAAQLASQGIEAAVIDVRTLSPLDMDPINASVANTGRLMLVQEGSKARRLHGRGRCSSCRGACHLLADGTCGQALRIGRADSICTAARKGRGSPAR